VEDDLVIRALDSMIDHSKVVLVTGFISMVDMDGGDGVESVRKGDLVGVLKVVGGVHYHTIVFGQFCEVSDEKDYN
jgi:hypothetical protein